MVYAQIIVYCFEVVGGLFAEWVGDCAAAIFVKGYSGKVYAALSGVFGDVGSALCVVFPGCIADILFVGYACKCQREGGVFVVVGLCRVVFAVFRGVVGVDYLCEFPVCVYVGVDAGCGIADGCQLSVFIIGKADAVAVILFHPYSMIPARLGILFSIRLEDLAVR